jgi:sugar lactone lactonase YvrE
MERMMRFLSILALVGLLAGGLVARAAPAVVTIDDRNVYPESLDSTPDGTLYIGGSNGRIYRARPGQAYAEPWIFPENSGLHQGVRGVVADRKSNTLWVCDNNGRESAIFRFALDSGKKRDSFDFPGGGHCNDIALRNGAAYLTDTTKGRILRLSPGASQLEVWYTNDASDPALDGIAWSSNGELYINTVNAGHLIRVDVNSNGSAGKGTVLRTTLDISQPDGLRLSPDGRLLMVEARAKPGPGLKDGRLDEVIVHGDIATIKVLASGFEYPTAVTVAGNTAWVLESKFDYQRNPALKGKDPGSFHVYRVWSRAGDQFWRN